MSAPVSCLVTFAVNTKKPTAPIGSCWLVTPPRMGEVVNVPPNRDEKGKEFIGRVVDVVWFIPPGRNNVGQSPTVRVYLDPVK